MKIFEIRIEEIVDISQKISTFLVQKPLVNDRYGFAKIKL